MRFGIAVDLGPAGPPLGERLRQLEPVFRRAEHYGFDSVWVGENYAPRAGSVTDFHGPSALTVLAALAGETTLGLGSGVVLLGAYDMLRLAYDIALVDSLSEGRLTVGIGLGPGVMASRFGQPTVRAAVADERLEALRALLSGADGYAGEEVVVEGGIHPLGHQGRMPPLLIGGGVQASLRRAARLGEGWYASSAYSMDRIRSLAGRFSALRAELDAGPARIAVNRLTVLKGDAKAARTVAARYAGGIVAAYGAVGALDDGGVPIPPGQVDIGPALAQRGIIGDAEDGLRLTDQYSQMGVTDIQFRIAPIGLPVQDILQTLDVLGEGVLPQWTKGAQPTKEHVEEHRHG